MNTRIGALILYFNGYCYQSFDWKYFKPLGNLETIIKLLDMYEVDEVCIIRPIKGKHDVSFLDDCKILSKINTRTPITFGGGIRKINDLKMLRHLPIERISLSSAFLMKNYNLLKKIKQNYGRQSIVCTIPLKIFENRLFIFNSFSKTYSEFDNALLEKFKDYINEYLVIDTESEGKEDKFNFDLLKKLNIENKKLIISGGIGPNSIKTAKKLKLASIIVENRYFYKELNNFDQK